MSKSAAASDDAHDENSSFIKTPQQLIVVLLLSFVVPVVGTLLLVHLVLGETAPDPAVLEPNAVAMRIQPIGHVEVVDANAPKVVRTGEQINTAVCAACHTTGAANAPKTGDKAAWASRLGLGLDGLTKNAIKGKNAMPPRGGVPDLTDYELARAIVFMANQSGGKLKEPVEPKAAAAPAPAADAKAKK